MPKDRSIGKKAIHRWELTALRGDLRHYTCKRCGVGPVVINVLSGKDSINKVAKRRGISPDCNIEIVKDVQES